MKIKFTPNNYGKGVLAILALILTLILFKKNKTLNQLPMKAINYVKALTWDYHSNRRIQTLHPAIRQYVVNFINHMEENFNITLRVTSALRTWEEQEKLYLQDKDGIDNNGNGLIDEREEDVTNAKPGESYHNYGLAFDVVEIKNGKPLWKNPNWGLIGKEGKKFLFTWGGDWKRADRPHFHQNFSLHHSELAKRYRAGKRDGHYVHLS
ncbi:M15 family metallopeptidase [Aquimarina sp. ERC-38]|uniref:M15 family metallopeptidase n=1 Tax=Aquimarina sp. ERC-38 TaxID=2949996 RepID=UPI00224553AF|nr:M15 family metallopeptidase [Aquimarina sp. ERC-38]UZO79741.1 M15 family metallopeptidase [Aquimarina sp. ERC-38]